MSQVGYENMDTFRHVYLEDSYVLNIFESRTELVFFLEAVLTAGHPAYTPPKSGEHYCYAKAKIVFPEKRNVYWKSRNSKPISGVDGEIDYGNIDSFFYQDGAYYLSGEWGELSVHSDVPRFELQPK